MHYLAKPLFLSIVITTAFSSCKKDSDLPSCIQSEIDDRERIGDIHLASVVKYDFQGEEVYLFNYEGGADFQSPILDAECNTICALGGIAGNVECDGVSFADEAVELETVWKD